MVEIVLPGKMHIYTFVLNSYKVLWHSVLRFKRSCTYKLFISTFNVYSKLLFQNDLNSQKNKGVYIYGDMQKCVSNSYKVFLKFFATVK